MTETSVQRRELVELLLRGRRAPEEAVTRSAGGTPLSRAQRRLWFLEQRHPGTAQNNIAFRLDLREPPERAVLEEALSRLQEVHQALRLRISGPPDTPVQEVATSCPVPLEWHELSGRTPDAAQEYAAELTADAARRPLDLATPPAYRATAVLLPDGRWRLVLVLHHLLVDGWSVGVLLEDLALLLSGRDVERPAMSFVDRVASHGEVDTPRRVREYWSARFADRPAAGTLAVREGTGDDPALRGGVIPFAIGAELRDDLASLAQRLGVTVYAVCLAALKVVLRRFADSPAVVVGSPSAGRDDPALDRVVGFFVTTLALRTDIALEDSFADVARRVHQGVIDALDHQPMPFDELVELAGASGADSGGPLFRTMLAWQGALTEESAWGDRLIGIRDLDTGTAKFDLTFALTESADGISGAVEWAERGTDEIAAAGALEAFLAVLRQAVRRPGSAVGDIALTRSSTVRPPDRPRHRVGPADRLTLADGLYRQARRTPHAVALIDEREGALDYAGLADRVARTAEALRLRGLRPGDRVALLLERSVDLVVAVHAVAAAGCGYVPIDTTVPPARIAGLLEAAGAGTVLCHGPTETLLPEGPWQRLDAAVGRSTSAAPAWETTPGRPGAAAYLLSTSGSTGRPKLVAFPADASLAFLDWMQSRMPLSADDRVLLKTPYGFDVSVWELFWPLRHGATLVVAAPTAHADPAHLATLIQRERVTVANFVPSLLERSLEQLATAGCTTLRYLLSAGEALTPSLRDRVHALLPAATLVNLYGPTETNAVTAHVCAPGDGAGPVPIGTPLPHTRLHVLDENLRPVPDGLRGELYIGGELGTAIGYWGRPAQTAERFVPDPYSREPGRRLYRTGDAVRRLPDGDFEYLGRLDRQVKLHGVRIEPGEIEAALVEHPAVASARALVLGAGEEAELTAFCTAADGTTADPDALRGWIAARLPRQFVPRTLLVLEHLPLNTNGKTDEKALAAIRRDHRAGPRTRTALKGSDPAERELHAAFEEVLGHEVPDREATFFALGGNSLLLLRLAAVLERRTGVRLAVADLARRPTVAHLAELVRASSAPVGPPVPLGGAPGAPRLVLLPPASGLALAYLALSEELGPALDVQGLDAPGFGATPPRTVPDFVAGLLPAVERLTEGGPVVLAGWSFGGVLAYELGVALSARGRGPAAVALFDSWVPAADGAPAADGMDGLAFLRGRGLVPEGLTEADSRALAAMIAATSGAFASYRPGGRADFPVHLIRAGHGCPGDPGSGYDDSRGWAGLAPRLRITEVAADHFGLLRQPAVHELAEQVRALTLGALAGHPTNTEGGSR
ncbi:non-ribosomal peptide synthetase [Streptomyces cyaneofuscatus]